jgi:protein FAM32A
MPADDYTSFSGGGALKLKGGRVSKGKKKKSKEKQPSDLERALCTGESSKTKERASSEKRDKDADKDADKPAEDEADAREPVDEYKTEAERRHEEYKRKKVRIHRNW